MNKILLNLLGPKHQNPSTYVHTHWIKIILAHLHIVSHVKISKAKAICVQYEKKIKASFLKVISATQNYCECMSFTLDITCIYTYDV